MSKDPGSEAVVPVDHSVFMTGVRERKHAGTVVAWLNGHSGPEVVLNFLRPFACESCEWKPDCGETEVIKRYE